MLSHSLNSSILSLFIFPFLSSSPSSPLFFMFLFLWRAHFNVSTVSICSNFLNAFVERFIHLTYLSRLQLVVLRWNCPISINASRLNSSLRRLKSTCVNKIMFKNKLRVRTCPHIKHTPFSLSFFVCFC